MSGNPFSLLSDTHWAILPEALDALIEKTSLHARGITIEGAASPRRDSRSRGGAVAVIPVQGPIRQHGGGLFEMLFGGASTDQLADDFRSAMADEEVRAVLLDIDSPGGSVFGVSELANEIYKARGKGKPIYALANGTAASAAYWIGAAADEFYVTPSGLAGSIGVFAVHHDISEMAAKDGVKPTIISAGKYKTEGNEFEPLSDDAHGAIQARIDEYYDLFISDIAKFRGTTEAKVRNGYGEGRALTAKAALSAGLVDKVMSYQAALAKTQRTDIVSRETAQTASLSFAEHAEHAGASVREFLARAIERAETRAQVGRSLSAESRESLALLVEDTRALINQVEQLLSEKDEPEPEADGRWADLRAFQLQELREEAVAEAALLGVI